MEKNINSENIANWIRTKTETETKAQVESEVQMESDMQLNSLVAPYNTINPQNLYPKSDHYDPTRPYIKTYLESNSSMYDNTGKYFDSFLFNKKFDQYVEQTSKERELKQNVRLYDLDRVENIQIAPYQLPIDKLLIKLKDV